MKVNIASLLALPAFLSLVVAVPSPAAYIQQPLSLPQSPLKPRWRALSDSIIETVWGRRNDGDVQVLKKATPKRPHVPGHTLARYGGDVVLRFNISTVEEATSLREAIDTLLLDVWEYADDWADIRLSEDIVKSLLGLLPESLQHAHKPLLRERELAQAIWDTFPTPRGADEVRSSASPSPHRAFSPALSLNARDGETNIFFNDYQPLSVIEPWLRLLASLFTTHVRLINLGISYQGRDIPGLRVGVHPSNDDDAEQPKRKTVLITGGAHAREWISTSTVDYVAYSLITGYGKNPAITKVLEDFDFVFVPTTNPDGYTYTWETDRLWRKNRQQTNLRFCQGIDLDHSFGFEWQGSASSNPCSEGFAGESPFEAVEAKTLASWAKNETEHNNVDFVGFLDLHSYSQQILYPYSYSCGETPPGLENLEELAMGMEKAIRLSHGHGYEVLPACEGNTVAAAKGGRKVLPRMEAAGGSALDWFYHELHVRYAYQIKLRDRGTYGFLLPKENIVPTGKEMLDAVLYFGSFLQSVYVAEKESRSAAKPDQSGKEEQEDLAAGEAIRVKPGHPLWKSTQAGPFPLSRGHKPDEVSEDGDTWVWVDADEPDKEDVSWELGRRRRR